ncbi:spermidine synthase [Streptomyces endophytica]|uniref:Spermidine synthase n=1 Tax=Streptomyces endophytica TaxID=2991496 RepID=A0ABY6P8X2_9ACTN|nr:spermidine synthase [Streptomyces endophytica]UZJ29632.1 spermidine synthase [Streptomyces endophytica]
MAAPVTPPQTPSDLPGPPRTLDRREGPYGEVVLRERAGSPGGPPVVHEIIANGCFLMDTSDGRSERLLVDAALHELPAGRQRPAVLIGGLGVGFSLARAAEQPRWGRITVVEREAAVIDWHRTGPLSAISAAALADPRSEILHTDLVAHLRTPAGPHAQGTPADEASPDRTGTDPTSAAGADTVRYDALCLDIDNGPDWTVTEDNNGLYSPAGLAACRDRLTPGGVLAVWSAQPSPAFEEALRNAGFQGVRTEEIPVVRGVPDVVHLARKGA